ncbi:unnamed protein product [Closterium sp. NIES-53]
MYGLVPLSLGDSEWRSTLLWHHRLGHPSLLRLRSMHSCLLGSGLPRSLPPLLRSPAPPCLPCVKGRQRATPHSSEFPPTTTPLQTLHMDVWGSARVIGTDQERYFLLVVDDYLRYTTAFPLCSKVDVTETLPTLRWTGEVGNASAFWVWGALSLVRDTTASKLSPRTLRCTFLGFPTDALLWQFYHPHSRRVLSSQDVTFDESVCYYRVYPHASHPAPLTPLFLEPVPPLVDPFPPQGSAPSGVSQVDPPPLDEPMEISSDSSGPAEGGDPAADGTATTRRSPCLDTPPGFPPQPSLPPPGVGSGGAATGGAETGGADTGGATSPSGSRAVGDPTGGPGVGQPSRLETLSPQQIHEWIVQRGRPGGGGYVVTTSGAAGAGATRGGAGATSPGGATGAGGAGAASPGGTAGAGGAGAAGTGCDGPASTRGAGAAGLGGATGATSAGGSTGAAGTGGASAGGARGDASTGGARAGGTGGGGAADGTGTAPRRWSHQSQPQLLPGSPLPTPTPHTEVTESLCERREPETRASTPIRARRVARPRPPAVPGTHGMALRPSSVPQRFVLTEPPASSLPHVPDPESDLARAASTIVTRLLAIVVIDPDFESTAVFALVAQLVDFAARSHLDCVTSLVTESESVCPPSVEGEPALGSDVLEDRQFELECLAAVLPRFASMLLCPEGDPDALDIPTPHSYAEAIADEYSSKWQTAMDVEMASWKSTGTYVDEVPPSRANIVDGSAIFRVKRPPGSPPAFKVHYVAQGFSQRQGVDYFQTFSPTPTMTALRVLLHIAAQRDYELHSLDFSTAFLQGSLHKEIWLRRPPDFTGTTLAALGFAPSSADPSLFLRTDTTLPSFYVLVCVDDLVFATADTEALALVKAELQERHTRTDLGELRSYLGLQITRDRARRTITLTQSHMVHQVFQRFSFQYSSPQQTPLPTGHSLSAPPSDESVEPSGPYPEFVGCLMYLMTCTRPDLAYPLSLLARYVAPGRHRKVCEAEIYAGAMAPQELRSLTYLLTNLGERPRSPPFLSYLNNNGGEFIGADFEAVLKKGIQHQLTVPYNPQQNGVAERFNRTLQKGARTLLGRAGLPDPFWVTALRQVALVKNRLLATVGDKQWVPYTKWYGSAPAVNMLRAYGCVVVFHVPKEKRGKLEASGRWGIHLGLAKDHKGWLIWDLTSQQLTVSRDVKFLESLYYKEWKQQQQKLPTTPLIIEADEVQRPSRQVQVTVSEEEISGVTEDGGEPEVVRAGSVAEQCDEDKIAHCYWAAVPEPKTLAEALSGPDAENWKQSVKEEYDSLLENETWELCELPPGKKAISSKLIFRHKYGPDGELTRYKSRLVAKGFQQTKGKDFDEIFAPVGKGTTLRVSLVVAANRGWRIKQMDITTAFLNGIILEELYMLQPEGLDDGSGRVCKLKKAIYGLKQAPRAWYHKLEETLLAGGFKKTECDHSLFLLQEKEQFSMLLVYVDDILLFSESSAMIERVEEMLEMQFKCSKMGNVKYFLGLHPCADEEVVGESDRKLFHSMVGALNYAANHTRPDIAFATSRLASVVSRPSHEQLEAAKRLVRYVSATASVGLEYSAVRQRQQRGAADLGKGEMLLTCYTDASFNSVKADGTSIGGYVCMFGGGAVSWRSKKQNEVGLSSCETVYMALHHGVKEVVWLSRLLEEISVCQRDLTLMFCDNDLRQDNDSLWAHASSDLPLPPPPPALPDEPSDADRERADRACPALSRATRTLPCSRSALPCTLPVCRPALRLARRPPLQPARRPALQPTRRPVLQPTCRPALQPTRRLALQPARRPCPAARALPCPTLQPVCRPALLLALPVAHAPPCPAASALPCLATHALPWPAARTPCSPRAALLTQPCSPRAALLVQPCSPRAALPCSLCAALPLQQLPLLLQLQLQQSLLTPLCRCY